MRDLAGLVVTPEKFETVRNWCSSDSSFPRTYEEWGELAALATRHANETGVVDQRPVDLDPDHFAGWCERVGIVPCLDALRAYSIVLRSPQAHPRYGSQDLTG